MFMTALSYMFSDTGLALSDRIRLLGYAFMFVTCGITVILEKVKGGILDKLIPIIPLITTFGCLYYSYLEAKKEYHLAEL